MSVQRSEGRGRAGRGGVGWGGAGGGGGGGLHLSSSVQRTLYLIQLRYFFTTIRQHLKQRSIQLIRSVALTKTRNSITVMENTLIQDQKSWVPSPLTNV